MRHCLQIPFYFLFISIGYGFSTKFGRFIGTTPTHYYMRTAIILSVLSLLLSCGKKDERKNITWKNIEKSLQSQLILAQDGDTIRLEAGYYWFTRPISIDGKKNLSLIGAGMDQTILSFAGQEEGSEGIRASNCQNLLLQGMTVEDAKGDNIKVNDTDGVIFRDIRVTWTRGPHESNGAYGLYPVLSKNVLIEYCIAENASDAGIYVGQSDSVIIRHNKAFRNVAGIESENSNYVWIHDNLAENNTGGILVFDLPGLTQYGSFNYVYNNKVIKNNHPNFAPKGNIVGVVPPGTGMLFLATRDLEVYDNEILHNRTIGMGIISYEIVIAMSEDETGNDADREDLSAQSINSNYELDSTYHPYPERIRIKNNQFANSYWFPSIRSDFGRLLLIKFPFKTPAVLWDGFVPPGADGIDLCFEGNQGFSFVNIDAPNDLKNMNDSTDGMACEQ